MNRKLGTVCVLVMLFLLSAVVYCSADELGELIFEDNFTEGVIENWTTPHQPGTGSVMLKEGAMYALAGDSVDSASPNTGMLEDVVVKMRFKLATSEPLMIYYRRSSGGEYRLNIEPGQIFISKHALATDWFPDRVAEFVNDGITLETTYEIVIKMRGNEFEVYLTDLDNSDAFDGAEPIIVWEDDTQRYHRRGSMGVILYGEAYLYGIQIFSLD